MIRQIGKLRFYFSSNYYQKFEIDYKLVGQRLDQIIQQKFDLQWHTLHKLSRKKLLHVIQDSEIQKAQKTNQQSSQSQINDNQDQLQQKNAYNQIENQAEKIYYKPKKIRDLSYRVQEKDILYIAKKSLPENFLQSSENTQQKKGNFIIHEELQDNLKEINEENEDKIVNQDQASLFKEMIFFETQNFMVLNKQPDFVSQGGSNLDYNLYTIGNQYLKQQGQIFEKIYNYLIVHRLDKSTSGTLIVAKNKQFASLLGEIVQKKSDIQKYYIAVVAGIPEHFNGNINHPLVTNGNKTKLANMSEEKHKNCETNYQVLSTILVGKKSGQIISKKVYNQMNLNDNEELFKNEQKHIEDKRIQNQNYETYSILKLRIMEGRKHQIRAHLQYILKTPIIGDFKYGYDKNTARQIYSYFKFPQVYEQQIQEIENNKKILQYNNLEKQFQNKQQIDKDTNGFNNQENDELQQNNNNYSNKFKSLVQFPQFLHCHSIIFNNYYIARDVLANLNSTQNQQFNKIGNIELSKEVVQNYKKEGESEIDYDKIQQQENYQVKIESEFPAFYESFFQQVFENDQQQFLQLQNLIKDVKL
ncbi:Pseudouridine synthase, catalytic domain [Pseudocohnilembus persalinus]|uniref:Pseudouridine synthase, catalytic domain n=1 Tax=Pseudocohnilembus persalinus TaxID=266149 RepID=A0A0V0R7K0_PSEPJ|nr:Pseudouridine synthase, catalytic domain [Pseudocohnilembus persalinus]|eukprot:KRX10152.1 Pseudouridine synthase, catalytic domain [Pseudocohnilembus persalinus]